MLSLRAVTEAVRLVFRFFTTTDAEISPCFYFRTFVCCIRAWSPVRLTAHRYCRLCSCTFYFVSCDLRSCVNKLNLYPVLLIFLRHRQRSVR